MNTSSISITIAELVARRARLDAAIAALEALDPPAQPSPTIAPAARPMARNGQSQKKKPKGGGTRPGAGGGSPRAKALVMGRQLVAWAAGLAEPFSTEDLKRAAGGEVSSKVIYGALWRWHHQKKWVVRVGPDQYRRSRLFPAVQQERVMGAPVESVAERLHTARVELEDAVRKHEPARMRLLGDMIAQLEGKK